MTHYVLTALAYFFFYRSDSAGRPGAVTEYGLFLRSILLGKLRLENTLLSIVPSSGNLPKNFRVMLLMKNLVYSLAYS